MNMKSKVAKNKAYDKKHGIKEGSKKDIAIDKKQGVYKAEMKAKHEKRESKAQERREHKRK